MNIKNVLMAFILAVMLSGGAVEETNLSFAEDYTVFSEEVVYDGEQNDNNIAYKLLPSSSSSMRRANRRATSLHRQRLGKKRSRWLTLSWVYDRNGFRDKWDKLVTGAKERFYANLAAQAERRARILQGGYTRIALMCSWSVALIILGLQTSSIVSLAGLGLLAGTVRDGSEYVEVRKGIVADTEQITNLMAHKAKADEVRNFKQAKFAKQVDKLMTELNAAKAQTMATKISLEDAENRLQHSDESRRPSGKQMLELHTKLEACAQAEDLLIAKVNSVLDTSTAVEAMSKVKADSYREMGDRLFVTNPQKVTCSYEIECKFPNDQAMSHSASMEMAAQHFKAKFREEGISQGCYTGDYSATDQNSIIVSVDSSLDNSVEDYASHDEMHFEDNGYVFCVEIKTPVWTIERATKRIPILMDAIKSFRIPGGSAGPDSSGRGFIDVQCGQHVHVGIARYGHSNEMRQFISRMERKIHNNTELSDIEVFWVNWMAAIVCNYSGMQSQIDSLMHVSRRSGNCYYSNPVNNYATRLQDAYALQQVAKSMKIDFAINDDGVVDSHVWKQMWKDFINIWCSQGTRSHYRESYMNTLDDWNVEEEDVPIELYRALNIARYGPANIVLDMIAAERGSGDGGGYPNVNMGALNKHGTVEFRQQGGLLNSDAMLAWLYFLHSLVCLSMGGMRFKLKPTDDHDMQIASIVNMTHHSIERMSASTAKADDLFQHLGLVDEGVLPPGWASFVQTNNALNSSTNKYRDFKAIGVGFGLMAVLSPMLAIVGAIVLLLNCGIGGVVKLYRNKSLSRREAFGLRKILTTELGSRGRQSVGVAMFEEGRGRVRKAARPGDESSSSGWTHRGGYATGWSRYESGSDMPAVAGPLIVEALAGSRDHRDYTADAWMVHTRYATNGAINERNAHPMRADNITLMHNGVVEDRHVRAYGNSEGWWDGDTRLAKDFVGNETDTFAIAAALNFTGSDNDGVELMSQMVDGSMRLAWVDEREKLADNISPRIHLWSNTQDLWFGETVNGNVVWASEKDILLDAFGDYTVNDKQRGKSHHGSCLKANSVFPAQIGAHYVIDYDFGLINLGQCGAIAKHDANAWRSGTKSKKTKKTSQNTKGEVMVTETKGGVTTIKPLSQTVDACSSPAKDCGVPADIESKWDVDETDGGIYAWDSSTQSIVKVAVPACPCGLSEDACIGESCPELSAVASADKEAFMLLGLEEAKEILSENAFTGNDWDCIDCLAGDCVCSVEQAVARDDANDMEHTLRKYLADNVDDVDYAALNPDERAVYDAFMESETRAG